MNWAEGRDGSHSLQTGHIIVSAWTLCCGSIYTKGKIAREAEREIFYVFISAKIATYADGP